MDSLIAIGTRTDRKKYQDHRWITDLLYFEGPILSLYKGSRDQDYFYYWCENDAIINRWLVIPVSREDIEAYLDGRITLYALFVNCATVTILDTNNQDDVANAVNLLAENVPDRYVPPTTSLFDASLCPTESYRFLIRALYVIDIDRRWFFDEFSEFEKLFTQLYSFMYTVEDTGGLIDESKVRGAFEQYPWRGGFSSVNFYRDLRRSIPSLHEPEVKHIEYHSPGEIKLELSAPIAHRTGEVLNAVLDGGQPLKRLYDEAHAFLRNSGLLKIDAEPDATVVLTEATVSSIRHYFNILCDVMRFRDCAEQIWQLADNPLIAIKIILSFYRRAVKLNKFQESGKLRFPR